MTQLHASTVRTMSEISKGVQKCLRQRQPNVLPRMWGSCSQLQLFDPDCGIYKQLHTTPRIWQPRPIMYTSKHELKAKQQTYGLTWLSRYAWAGIRNIPAILTNNNDSKQRIVAWCTIKRSRVWLLARYCHSCHNLGQIVHTYVLTSLSNIVWYWPEGSE